MLGSLISIMEGFNTAHDSYKIISGVIKGNKNETTQYLEQMNNNLAEMNNNLAGIKHQFERLADNILYTPTLQSVQDVTQSRQRTIEDLREVRASLEPVQRAVGEEILSSAMITTPDKMQNALVKSPWEVLVDIRPVNLATKPNNNPDMVPIIFNHGGVYYIGWQMRGSLVPVFDCQYDELWVPTSALGVSSFSDNDKSPVIVVATRGLRGDCQTISAAIKKAAAGSRILVKPGVYQESLVIDKPLQIIGDGAVADIVVESWEGHCIWMNTNHALVRGLTLLCRASVNVQKVAVYIPQGQLTLEHCDITSDSLACVAIHGSETEGIVSHCQIHDSKGGIGVFVFDNGTGRIENCDIFGNAVAGIQISEGGNLIVQHCQIHDSKEGGGVFVYENGTGRIENCDIFGNANVGIAISEGGNPIVQHCQIHDSKEGGGVFVNDNGTGRIENCDIFGNAKTGIEIKTGGNPIVQKCTIKQNGYEAVWVYKGGAGTIEDCDLRDNTKGAWDIESGCQVRRSGNKE